MAQTQALYRNSSAPTSGKTKLIELSSRLDFSRRFRLPVIAIADFTIGEALDLAGLVVFLAALFMVAA
jgi:hypothetical protein